MKIIGCLSDTHSYLDAIICQELKEVSLIIHAGDIGAATVIDQLTEIAPVAAVYGNIDGADIRSKFPEYQLLEIEELRLLLIHIAGSPPKYNPTVRRLIQELQPDVLICGHSHILRVGRSSPDKELYINPGAAGQHGFHQRRTMLRFRVTGKEISGMEVVDLGKRGSIQPGKA